MSPSLPLSLSLQVCPRGSVAELSSSQDSQMIGVLPDSMGIQHRHRYSWVWSGAASGEWLQEGGGRAGQTANSSSTMINDWLHPQNMQLSRNCNDTLFFEDSEMAAIKSRTLNWQSEKELDRETGRDRAREWEGELLDSAKSFASSPTSSVLT